jgi:hypothetical protein
MATPETSGNAVVDEYGNEIVRFITPVLVGWFITLGAKAGFHLTTAEAYQRIFPFVSSGYFIIIRYLETKVPEFGRLLGVKATKPVASIGVTSATLNTPAATTTPTTN